VRRLGVSTRLALVALLALLLGGGCSLAQSLQMQSATPRQRETVYAVVGTFAVMAVVAGLIAGAPAESSSEPSGMPRPQREPLPGPW
jgi:hypothetical protein